MRKRLPITYLTFVKIFLVSWRSIHFQASDNPNLVGAQTLPVRVGGALGSSSAGATSGDAVGHVTSHALDVVADDEEAPPAYHDIFPEGVPQEYIRFGRMLQHTAFDICRLVKGCRFAWVANILPKI